MISSSPSNDYTRSPTLAKLVRRSRPDWSWNECRRAIASGRIYVDGAPSIHPDVRFAAETSIEIKVSGSPVKTASRDSKVDLKILFHDKHLIVIDKPSGVESVPFETKLENEYSRKKVKEVTAVDLARTFLETVERQKLPPLRVVHRLDKGTSGIMVFARTKTAERNLGQQFRSHDIRRTYEAICIGTPQSKTIRSRISPNRGDGLRGSVSENDPRQILGKEAITHIKTLETRSLGQETLSKVECHIETGRTHQIRIHLNEQGHPLAGEKIYRARKAGLQPLADHSKAPRIALHAKELGFIHPITNQQLFWQSPLPQDLHQWWITLTPIN